jgi:hypothetical protein
MMRKRKPSKKAVKKTNRRLTPEEQLVRNITSEPGTPLRKRSGRGHAKPLQQKGQESGGQKTQVNKGPNRIQRAIARAFAPIRSSLSGEWLGQPDALRHLPFAAFIGVLFIGYTYLQYRYEYDERAIKEGKKELQNLRHHEQALRGRFESQLQRSRLDEAMADVDLSAPSTPPIILPDATTTAP